MLNDHRHLPPAQAKAKAYASAQAQASASAQTQIGLAFPITHWLPLMMAMIPGAQA
jgi:hypothetical protein